MIYLVNYELVCFGQNKVNRLLQKRDIERYLYNQTIVEQDKLYHKCIIDDIDKEIAFIHKAQYLMINEK